MGESSVFDIGFLFPLPMNSRQIHSVNPRVRGSSLHMIEPHNFDLSMINKAYTRQPDVPQILGLCQM